MIRYDGIEALKLGNVCIHSSGIRHGPDVSCSIAELKRYREQEHQQAEPLGRVTP